MITIGLTGGIGSGKTTLTNIWHRYADIPIIDSDTITRELHKKQEIQKKIINLFGKEILSDDHIDKFKLRTLIFNSPQAKEDLERLLHPLINQAIQKKLSQKHNAPYQILASALLFETQQDQLCNITINISCSHSEQIKRTTLRDSVPETQVESIIEAQLSTEKKNEQSNILIYNETSKDILKDIVRYLHGYIIEGIKSDTLR